MYLIRSLVVFSGILAAAIFAGQPARAGQKDMAVVGDSIATGIYYGLRDMMRRENFTSLARYTKGATGLAPQWHYDWIAEAKRIKAKHPGYIIVALGGNDRQDMFVGKSRLKRFTKEWWAEYEKRVDHFMKIVTAGNTKVFWVSLPTVRRPKMSQDYARLNRVYESLAAQHDITYIDVYALTAVANGGLSPKPLRGADGIHFTSFGNITLGRIILRVVKDTL